MSGGMGRAAGRVKGEEILLASRLMNLADVVEVFRRTGGVEAACGDRAGAQRHAVRS